MWLVLCATTDLPAIWLYEGLKRRGLSRLELVTDDALATARWEHRVGDGGASWRMSLQDGRSIYAGEIHWALNRLADVPAASLLLIHPNDREYVRQELYSFLVSCLGTIAGVLLNPPTAWGLSGRWRHISEWLALAGRAGLPVPDYRESTLDLSSSAQPDGRIVPAGTPVSTIFAVDGMTLGPPLPGPIREGCLRLAALAGTPLLGIDLLPGEQSPWTFGGAHIHPDFRLGGEALLDSVAQRLSDGWEAGQ